MKVHWHPFTLDSRQTMHTGESAPAQPVLVRMTGITKRFGNVTVLHGVDLEIRQGEVLILAGENGAGKSTLIKILGGVYSDFEGEITIGQRPARPRSPLEANALGIAVIYQELSLVPSMTVADNIFLGRSLTRAGFMDDRSQCAQAQQLLDQLGIDIDVNLTVEQLPIGSQQLTEIAKALAQKANVIVMDEPTSSLNAPEVEKLFGLIRDLKKRGCGIVYITHKLEEIKRIGDRITVLRDGQHIASAPASTVSTAQLLQWMVGRQIEEQFPHHQAKPGNVRLELENFSVPHPDGSGRNAVEGVSLVVHAGEILGFAGLQGSGASELFLGLFGARGSSTGGQVRLNGQPLSIRSPRRAIDHGIALLTNDRKTTGLVLPLSIVANTTLADLPRLSPWGWRRSQREIKATGNLAQTLSLRAASLEMEVGLLSGGNQQKTALAKWLQTGPQLLLLDEPTRGVDIGAK
ncbi:MAG: sugar ABC transporter ATP-binding protein, partial [Candidatus Omnitrophica bacterium]|nr:sugar ABC transporter ATP-binding protein [Candidatus Omnitrophota bacterium]